MTSPLTHFDAAGKARMVDVSAKPATARRAIARGSVTMSPETLALVAAGTAAKGDVLGVARLAGIMAAKRKPLETWSLADIGLSSAELGSVALTRVTEARAPEAKPPTERIENVPPAEAATKIADWLAARKLI